MTCVRGESRWLPGYPGRLCTESSLSPPCWTLFSASCTDATHVWAVGSRGLILSTSSGGSSWTEQHLRDAVKLDGVAFSSASVGWITGYAVVGGQVPVRGMVFSTVDGGRHWRLCHTQDGEYMFGVDTAGARRVWAVGSVILSSDDVGASWTMHHLPVSARFPALTAVASRDTLHAWAVGAGGDILATRDGGKTWTPQATRTSDWLIGVSFSDPRHGWMVGARGAILATSDGGRTWRQVTAPLANRGFLGIATSLQ